MRNEHLLAGILRAGMFQMAGKGVKHDDLERFFSNPETIRLPKLSPLTEEEANERANKDDRSFAKALMTLAGDSKTTVISREEFRRKYGV